MCTRRSARAEPTWARAIFVSYPILWWGWKLTLFVGQLGRRRLFFREKRHFSKKLIFSRHVFNKKTIFRTKTLLLSLKTILTSLPLKNQYWRNFFLPKLIVFWSSYDQIPIFHKLFHHFWHCTCNLWLEDMFFGFPGVQTRFSYGFCLCLLKMSCLVPIPCNHKFSRQI